MIWWVSCHLKRVKTQPGWLASVWVGCFTSSSLPRWPRGKENSSILVQLCQGQVLVLTSPEEDWHLTFVLGSGCLKLAREVWFGTTPDEKLREGVPGLCEHGHWNAPILPYHNRQWKTSDERLLAIESWTSHILSLGSHAIPFPLLVLNPEDCSR